MRKPVRTVKAGDHSVYPFNHAFTEQERHVFQLIDQLRTTLTALTQELARTPYVTAVPPQNYNPKELDPIRNIEDNIERMDLDLRWIPGGVYRYD